MSHSHIFPLDIIARSIGDIFKPPSVQAPPAPSLPPPLSLLQPTPQATVQTMQTDATVTAQAAQDSRRRELLASGGQTNFTGPGGAAVLAGQPSAPSLLGA